jgi:hypothetical protein
VVQLLVQYVAAQYGLAQYLAVQPMVMQYLMAQYWAVQPMVMHYLKARYGTTQHWAAQYLAVQLWMMQYLTIGLSRAWSISVLFQFTNSNTKPHTTLSIELTYFPTKADCSTLSDGRGG